MATIKDVAELAQVSKSTASYAFNKPHLVSAETLDRILTAAKSLNYRPNLFAQGLASGKTQMIGLLVPDIRYPFNATIAHSIEKRLRDEGYIVVVTSTDGDTENTVQLLGQLHQRGVGGFILVSSFFGISPELTKAMRTLRVGKVPLIIGGYALNDPTIDQVSYQPQASTERAINYLIQLGHREIAYIGPFHSRGQTSNRFLGYQKSLMKHRVPVRPELVIETDITPREIKAVTHRLLSLPTPPTAIFAINDVVSFAIMDYCYEQNINIPEKLSLISFDYQALVNRTTPGITSIVVPVDEIGIRTAELLLHRLKEPDGETQHIELQNEFVIRESTKSII